MTRRGRVFLTRVRVALGRMVAFQVVMRAGEVRYIGRGSLFVSTADPRGRYVQRSWGVTQPNVAAAWLAALRAVRPGLAVDIGANYGEIALLARYDDRQRCLVVEANPEVVAVLQRSVDTHHSRARIRVADYAVNAGGADEVTLFVDPLWSGAGSLARKEHAVTLDVRATSLDELVAHDGSTRADRLVMKVDVEGAEVEVIKGAARTLAEAGTLVLIVECNEAALRSAGASPGRLIAELKQVGDVHQLSSNGRMRPPEDGDTDGKVDLLVFRGTKSEWLRLRVLCFVRAMCGG